MQRSNAAAEVPKPMPHLDCQGTCSCCYQGLLQNSAALTAGTLLQESTRSAMPHDEAGLLRQGGTTAMLHLCQKMQQMLLLSRWGTDSQSNSEMLLQRSLIGFVMEEHASSPALRYSAELRNSGEPVRKLGFLEVWLSFLLTPLEPGRAPPLGPLFLAPDCCWEAADCACSIATP